MKALLKSMLFGICFFYAQNVDAQNLLIIHAGKVIAIPGEEILENTTIVIQGDTITNIISGFVSPEDVPGESGADVRFYDLSTMTVLPGLIDGHVHLTLQPTPAFALNLVQMSEADRTLLAFRNAQSTLKAGFTTVRDVGAIGGDAIFALRDAIDRGDLTGPRIFASGSIISITGGHGDWSNGFHGDFGALLRTDGVCDGIAACRMAVREQIRRGADQIKVAVTGGALSNVATGTEQQLFNDELEAIIDTAHSLGRPVTAHAHGREGVASAVALGVDSIEHGSFLDRRLADSFRRKAVYLVPTLLAGDTIVQLAKSERSPLTEVQKKKALFVGEQMKTAVRLAHERDVLVALGTDAGVFPHGRNGYELKLLVEAGMTAMDAIRSATVIGARNLGQYDNIGSIEVGKKADLIAVDADPIANIDEILEVDFVMKGGEMFYYSQ